MLTIFLVLLTASFLLPSLYRSPQRPSGPKRDRQIGTPSAPDEDGGLLGICFLRTLAESSISSQAGHRHRAAEPLAKASNEAMKTVGQATMNCFGDVAATSSACDPGDSP